MDEDAVAVLAERERRDHLVAVLGDALRQQVVDPLDVHLHELHLDRVRELRVECNLLVERAHHPVGDALLRRAEAAHLADRERLAAARLAVREQRAVVPHQRAVHERAADDLVDFRIVLLLEGRGEFEVVGRGLRLSRAVVLVWLAVGDLALHRVHVERLGRRAARRVELAKPTADGDVAAVVVELHHGFLARCWLRKLMGAGRVLGGALRRLVVELLCAKPLYH